MNTSDLESSEAVRRKRLVVAVGVMAAVLLLLLATLAIGVVGGGGSKGTSDAGVSAAGTAVKRPHPAHVPAPSPVSSFDRTAFSIDDPASLWIVVNKMRPLTPVTFAPADLTRASIDYSRTSPRLRKEAAQAADEMFEAADDEADLQLMSLSTYRDYETQSDLYDADVKNLGVAAADNSTARAGYSEHQTGLAIDIGASSGRCSIDVCFAQTPEGQWLAANSWRFGYILRYPSGKTPITGYVYEPWHFRYVGLPLATEMHNTSVATLEEFFSLPAAPTY